MPGPQMDAPSMPLPSLSRPAPEAETGSTIRS